MWEKPCGRRKTQNKGLHFAADHGKIICVVIEADGPLLRQMGRGA